MADTGPILFLFKAGRRERLRAAEPFPTEFFYGFCELKEAGLPVSFLDEAELEAGAARPLHRFVATIFRMLSGGLPAALEYTLVLARRANRERFRQATTIIATTTTFGFCLALLRRFGVVRRPVVLIAMGVLPEDSNRWARRFTQWLIKDLILAPVSKSEVSYLNEQLHAGSSIHYLPFGVDTAFWSPSPDSGDYVLSIGNDHYRDYATLINAWQPSFPKLKIVTRLKIQASDKPNVEIIAGDWRCRLLSDVAVRDLVRASRFVVLPLHQTVQPSGQSACLQAMSCGKAVIISDIRGLWDREALRDDDTCVLVEPASPEALRSAIERLLDRPADVMRIGAAARIVTAERWNVHAMALGLGAILTSIQAQMRPPIETAGST